MDELLKQVGYKFRGFRRGQVVEVVVVEKTSRAIYFDIGGKSEGMVIDREMKAARDYIDNLQIGDKVTAIVTQTENENGHTLLSLKKAAQDSLWKEFEEKLKTGETATVAGREVNRGGLIVEIKGLQGFIPSSQFGAQHLGKIDQLINKQIEAKVIEVDRAANRLIFSEKEVSEAGLIKERAEILKKVKVGDILTGTVSGVMPFGLFIRLKILPEGKKTKAVPVSLEGLVHISEISWEKVDDPGKFYKQQDVLKVKVIGVGLATGKLNLSIKQLETDPWSQVEKNYPVDTKIKGEVVRLAPFGVFVRLTPGVEALIHTSKIPAEKTFKIGDKVDCFVESIDKQARRMSLGLVLKEKPVGYK